MQKSTLTILITLLSINTYAQSKVKTLYKQKEYNKCIKLSDKNYEKGKDIQNSLLYKALSLTYIKETKYSEDYKKPEYNALKTIHKLFKKSENNDFIEQNSKEVANIIKTAEQKANALLYDSLYSKAKKYYNVLSKINPQNSYYYFAILKCKYDVDKLTNFEPLKEEIYNNITITNEKNKAIKLFAKLGDSIFSIKDYRASAELCKLSLRLDSLNIKTHIRLSASYINDGKEELLAAHIKQLLRMLSEDPHYLNDKNTLHKDYEKFASFLYKFNKYRPLLYMSKNEAKLFPRETFIHNANKTLLLGVLMEAPEKGDYDKFAVNLIFSHCLDKYYGDDALNAIMHNRFKKIYGRKYSLGRADSIKNKIDIDKVVKHVKACPEKKQVSVKSLVGYLNRFSEDTEKIFAIQLWIHENIEYLKDGRSQSAENVLQRKTAVCSGHSNLFIAMCKEAGFKAFPVIGYLGDVDEANRHQWAYVEINGELYITEPTGKANSTELFISSFAFIQPIKSITGHFPDITDYQFLFSPLSKEEYINQRTEYLLYNHSGSYYDKLMKKKGLGFLFSKEKKNNVRTLDLGEYGRYRLENSNYFDKLWELY